MELYSGQNSSVVGADKPKSTPKSPDPTGEQSGVSTQVLLWEMMDLATDDLVDEFRDFIDSINPEDFQP